VTLLLGIIAGMWAVALVPPYLRNRNERVRDSISSFRQQLSVLERTRPGGLRPMGPMAVRPIPVSASSAMPIGRAEARRRRRDILFTLAGAVGITLLLALMLGGVAILCQLVADALLGGYVYLLVQMRKTEAERTAKVRYLPTKADSPEPALLLHRTAAH